MMFNLQTTIIPNNNNEKIQIENLVSFLHDDFDYKGLAIKSPIQPFWCFTCDLAAIRKKKRMLKSYRF